MSTKKLAIGDHVTAYGRAYNGGARMDHIGTVECAYGGGWIGVRLDGILQIFHEKQLSKLKPPKAKAQGEEMKTCEQRIQAAILKERESCARIASKAANFWLEQAGVCSKTYGGKNEELRRGQSYAAEDVALSIRARTKKPAKEKK